MQWWQRERNRQLLGGIGVVVGFFLPGSPLMTFLSSWSLYAILYLVLTWFAVRRGGAGGLAAIAAQSRKIRGAQRWIVAAPQDIALGAATTALVTVILVMPRADRQEAPDAYVLAVCLVGVIVSWMMLQLGFLLTYVGIDTERRGLRLPDGGEPGVVDYLYFTVAVGTTFGATDVEVHHTDLRRQVLTHGVLAFVFNTLVLTVAITFTTNYLG